MIDSIPGLVCRKVQCPWCRRAPEPRVDRIIFQWAAASRQPPAKPVCLSSPLIAATASEGCWPLAVILQLGAKEPRSAWCGVLAPGSHYGHTMVTPEAAGDSVWLQSCRPQPSGQLCWPFRLPPPFLHSTSKNFESSQFYSRSFICFWEDNFWRRYFQLFFVGKLDI